MKKGFVLLETIVVTSILCIVLMMLYTGVLSIIRNNKYNNTYDSTEYLYKTYILGQVFQKLISSETYSYDNSIKIFNDDAIKSMCKDGSYPENLIAGLRVRDIYIASWNTKEYDTDGYSNFIPSIRRYVKNINPAIKDDNSYRIIVRYEDETLCENIDYEECNKFQYASIEFKSRM